MQYLVQFLALAILSTFALAAAGQPTDLESRRKALRDLLQEQWEYVMRHYPTFASMLGDKRYNDQLEDYSQQAIDDDLEQSRRFLTRFEAINTAGFPDQEVLNQQLMVRDLMADGLMPPRMLLEKAATQANTIGTTAAEKSPFAHPFDKFPDSISEADRKRLREAGLAAVRLRLSSATNTRRKAAPSLESGPCRMVPSAMLSGSKRAPPRPCHPKKSTRLGSPR